MTLGRFAHRLTVRVTLMPQIGQLQVAASSPNSCKHMYAVQILGINVQPLLAVGGVSGIAIGFGAQSVSANAITGINLVRLCIFCRS